MQPSPLLVHAAYVTGSLGYLFLSFNLQLLVDDQALALITFISVTLYSVLFIGRA